jgi:hypothetical protein
MAAALQQVAPPARIIRVFLLPCAAFASLLTLQQLGSTFSGVPEHSHMI